MALTLPPKLRTPPAAAEEVYRQLTSVIAGHPQAATSYAFYEEIDRWLGPWGSSGYPIAYGKFYNQLFTSNEKLMASAVAKAWVWKTTILLQEGLRDFVVDRVRRGTLGTLTEAELRRAAFATHPSAYDTAGLSMLALVEPRLLIVISTIPMKEFDPRSRNFGPTITQVFDTLDVVAPRAVGIGLAAAAGPAHSGLLRIAVQKDRQELLAELAVGRELDAVRTRIARGEVDHVPLLDEIIDRLNARQFYDMGAARAARQVVDEALRRRQELVQAYQRDLARSPEVRMRVLQAYPAALQPRTR